MNIDQENCLRRRIIIVVRPARLFKVITRKIERKLAVPNKAVKFSFIMVWGNMERLKGWCTESAGPSEPGKV